MYDLHAQCLEVFPTVYTQSEERPQYPCDRYDYGWPLDLTSSDFHYIGKQQIHIQGLGRVAEHDRFRSQAFIEFTRLGSE